MASSYTSLLGLVLPVTGELSGTWGQTINDSLTSLLDTAIAGTTTLSTDADVTLTTTTGTANQARQAIVLWTANGTATRNITAPAQSKIYTVINASAGTQSIVFRGAGPTAGVTIVKGESAVVAWNGSDFIKISNTGGAASFTNVTVSGTTTLSGLTASTALALNASKEVVSVTNTGTGNNVLSASPTLTGTVAGASLQLSSLTSGRVTYAGASGLLTDSANMTFNGTRLTVADLADSGLTATRVVYSTTGGALTDSANLTFDGTSLTLGGNPTLSAGTANGVAYLNGSKVLTTGSALTFDGKDFGLGNSRVSQGANTSTLTIDNTGNYQAVVWRVNGTTVADAYTNGTAGFIFGTENNSPLQFQIAGAEAMRLTSTGLDVKGKLGVGYSDFSGLPTNGAAFAGSVGIGTSSPTNALTVGTTSAGKNIAIYSSSNGNNGLLRLYDLGGTERLQLSANSTGEAVYYSPTGSVHAWYINSEQMRLTSTGLGIGTSSPSAKLHVTSSAAGSYGGVIYNTSATGQGLTVRGGSTSSQDAFNVQTYDGNTALFTVQAGGNVLVQSGNLGLGVTPSAWGAYLGLQVGNASVGDTIGGNNALFASNIYYGGSPADFRFISASTTGTMYRQLTGAHSWHTTGTGTGAANGVASLTQAMTLDASGNLGVGATSSLKKLTVQGSTADRTVEVIDNGSNDAAIMLQLSGVQEFTLGVDRTDNSFRIADSGALGTNDRLVIDSSGNFIQTVNTTAATLTTNGTLTFSIVDNSTLRIAVRGSDGATRTATVALT